MQSQPLNEGAVIAAARRYLNDIKAGVVLGIGDDAALVHPPAGQMLLTTDLLVEHIHFERAWTSPADLGWKLLAVNLSDIAAMGGTPRFALLSLGLPVDLDMAWIEDFYGGLRELADRHEVAIVGGDTVASPGPIVANVALVGETKTLPITRQGSVPGDLLFVTGTVGAGAAGLWACRHLPPKDHAPAREVMRRLLRPEPQLTAGRILATWAGRISLLDDSDGLVRSVDILAEANGAGAVIDLGHISICPEARSLAPLAGVDPLQWALYGGDDYPLIGAAPPPEIPRIQDDFAPAGLSLTVFGELTQRAGVWLREANGKLSRPDASQSFRHFPELR